jgi:hypothetical protein
MNRMTNAIDGYGSRVLANLRALVAVGLAALGLLSGGAVHAQGFAAPPSFDPLYANPPWLQTNVDEYMVTVFEADRAAIQALLPAGIRPAASNTVGLSHYIVREGAGLAPYEATYLFAEVEGFDDPSGGKGRWVLWGLYSPDRVVVALRDIMGIAIRVGTTKIDVSGRRMRGAGSRDGKVVLASEISLKGDGPAPAGGVLHYPALRVRPTVHGTLANSELVLSRLPWHAKLQMADPVSVTLDFPAEHPLRKLEPKKLLYAYTGKDVNWMFGHIQVIETKP